MASTGAKQRATARGNEGDFIVVFLSFGECSRGFCAASIPNGFTAGLSWDVRLSEKIRQLDNCDALVILLSLAELFNAASSHNFPMFNNNPHASNPGSTAWRQWYDENATKLLLFSRQLLRSPSDAEDVLHNAILKVWNARKKRAGGKPPLETPDPAEIYTAIRRTAIDLGRKQTRRIAREEKVIELDDARGISYFDDPFDTTERNTEITAALKRLPTAQREVVALKIWGELTFAEIGDTLDISENTAASRYRYAMEALRRGLGKGRESYFKNLMVI